MGFTPRFVQTINRVRVRTEGDTFETRDEALQALRTAWNLCQDDGSAPTCPEIRSGVTRLERIDPDSLAK